MPVFESGQGSESIVQHHAAFPPASGLGAGDVERYPSRCSAACWLADTGHRGGHRGVGALASGASAACGRRPIAVDTSAVRAGAMAESCARPSAYAGQYRCLEVWLAFRSTHWRLAAVKRVAGDAVAGRVGHRACYRRLSGVVAGKSTLLSCIAGVLTATHGQVRIAGFDTQTHLLQARRALGVMVGASQLQPLLTALECLQLAANSRGLTHVPAATLAQAEALGCSDMLQRRIAHLSLGTRQKVGILIGLLDDPPVLLLDEPLNALDRRSTQALRQLLQQRHQRDACTLMATHAVEVAERWANRVLLLEDGRLLEDWPDRAANQA